MLLLALLSCIGVAQERKPDTYEAGDRAQSFYVELGGPGFISANYDFRFQQTRNSWGARAGIGYFAVEGERFLTVPVQLNYLLGKNGNYFEMGAGASYVNNSYTQLYWDANDEWRRDRQANSQIMGSLTFGYRKQPIDGGFNFRAGLSPIFYKENFIPYLPYLSFGYSF
ncbi:hypothetical protein SAMN05421747_11930 [Parapedobacter composti]|uniref:Outer membrane protein beta-barrel domain-containing protein n=2 Tax=Parapedobacter composti TaxID=623281 RepID=A0A1I1LGE2_9SPHI|nr:hypothetical protein SAMN05421747_11930 [Parapedobacter composti]